MNVEVFAAIITYYPGPEFEGAVRVLRTQVGRLVVVDNHSPDVTVENLRRLAKQFDFFLIENPDNFGIGTALNQSIEWARKHKDCEFILFFDQDSLASGTFVAEMVAEYRRNSGEERVFLVTPKIIYRRTNKTYTHRVYRGKYLVAQTSGSLIPMRVFAEEGLYREDLFIDYVDYEFCLRVAVHGWKIVYCEAAVLWHDPGTARQFSLLGIGKVTTLNHSPLRRYYLMRNGIWTIKKYGILYPGWAADHMWQMLKGVVRVLLFERNRASTILMWFRAVWDVLCSRYGKYHRAMHA